MGRTSSMTLLTLPSELIEVILICSCSPHSVASIARTCSTLRTLVYASPDSHLWRELFLTTWDDPRPALEHRALIDPRVYPTIWNWGIEYRRRVRADKWLKAWRCDILPADVDPHNDPGWYAESMSTLVAVLDTLMTLCPFPAEPPIALTVMAPAVSKGNARSGSEWRERVTSAPPLPPLLIVLASGISVVSPSQSGVRLGRTVYGPHASRALQGDGLGIEQTPIPTPSLPPHLMRALLASHTIGVRGVPPYAPHMWDVEFWGRDPLGDVFHRIICITGFVPIAPPISPSTFVFMPGSVSERTQSTCLGAKNGREVENETMAQEDGRDYANYLTPDGKRLGSIPEPFPTPSEQHANARILARRRVYDMRYLRGDRLWGPFHPVSEESLNAHSGNGSLESFKNENDGTDATTSGSTSRRRGTQHLNTLAWAMGMDVELDEIDSTTDDDSGDEDWQDPAETGQEASSSSRTGHGPVTGAQDAEIEEADSDLEELSILSRIFSPRHVNDSRPMANSNSSRRRNRRPRALRSKSADPRNIKPEHLKVDYTYLASVRIVVEANLRELYGGQIDDDDDELASSDTWTGGVGMFWEDEAEILRARPGSLEQASPRPSSSTTTTSGKNSTGDPSTFEFVDILARFRNLEAARLGGSCGYWSAWIARQRSGNAGPVPSSNGCMGTRKFHIVTERDELEKPIDTTTPLDKGKGKEKCVDTAVEPELGDWEIGPDCDECEGWDWAGVAGIWKRCVCWMDYRELLFFNLDPTKFMTLNTQEACRMISMELWITGYTRAPLMPVYDQKHDPDVSDYCLDHKNVRYFRPPPIIHFSGVSIGSDRDSLEDRPLGGSVQLIGGGEVRWQLNTYIQKPNVQRSSSTPEWSSEGVQVGTIGSAVGILGMWTGAGHERADPLGPFWMWKVA